MARLTLKRFGGFQAWYGERGQAFSTRKAEALFAYLAVRPDQDSTRNKLAAMLWGSAGKEQARQSLRQSLSAIRRIFSPFQPGIVLVEADRVTLNRSAIDVDVTEFERLASEKSQRTFNRPLPSTSE